MQMQIEELEMQIMQAADREDYQKAYIHIFFWLLFWIFFVLLYFIIYFYLL